MNLATHLISGQIANDTSALPQPLTRVVFTAWQVLCEHVLIE